MFGFCLVVGIALEGLLPTGLPHFIKFVYLEVLFNRIQDIFYFAIYAIYLKLHGAPLLISTNGIWWLGPIAP